MPMAVALAAIIAASMAAAGAHAQQGGNGVGVEQAAGSLWDAGHMGGQHADLGHISPQPIGGHYGSTAGAASHAAHQQAPSGSDGSSVSAGQAPESEWDTGYIGDQYADLGQVSPQPPGGYDDSMSAGSSQGAAAKQEPESEWDTAYGDKYADPGHASPQPPAGHDDSMTGGMAPGAAPKQEQQVSNDGSDVGARQAAESLWDTSRIGDQYADLGYVSPQPPAGHDDSMTGGMAPGAANPPADGPATKVADELDTMRALVRSMGATVPELPDDAAAPFNARFDAINAQRASADAAGLARLDAQSRAVVAEYGLAALALAAERTPEVERATEFLTRLAALHTAHAAAIAGGAPAGGPPGLDALYAEYGLRHAPGAKSDDAVPSETVELVGADGQIVALTGDRAAEFLRRSDALAARYAEAHDLATGNRTAAIAAVEAEYRALYAEFGAAFGAEQAAVDGNEVGSEQAVRSLWDTSDIGERYADLDVPPREAVGEGAATGGSPQGAAAREDGPATKVADELDTMRALVRSMGATVPELPDDDAAPFNARFDAINAQRASADAAGLARLDAQSRAVVAEYGLAALALAAERTPEVERATEFLTRLAALHTAHAAAIAGGAPAGGPPGLDALYAEYGLRHAPDAKEDEAAPAETLEFVGTDGQAVTLTGERAAEFLRRSDALAERYAAATDAAPSDSRDADLAALEAEYAALLAEYGIAAPPPAQAGAQAENSIEFTRSDGQVVKLSGERAAEFLRRSDGIGARYSEAYSSPASASRTAALEALEAEHDALLAEFGLGAGPAGKGGEQAPGSAEDAPATAGPPAVGAPAGGTPAAGGSPPAGGAP